MRALILIILFGGVLAAPKTVNRIVGGYETTIEDFPYMSNMQYSAQGTTWAQFCGGTLITPDSILSAAHCYVGDSPSQWRVRLGSTVSGSFGTVYAVSKLTVHSGYSTKTLDNDVAIVKLATDAKLSRSVQLAQLAGPRYSYKDGDLTTLIGWGVIYTNGPNPFTLRYVDVNIINKEVCAERYAELKHLEWPDVTERMVCSGILDVGGKDSCQGDSGGPMVHNGIVLGIISWGFDCADAVYPGVNALVPALADWIIENTV